jgi:hypothetical protein
MSAQEVVLEESEEDQVTASIDADGWLKIGVLFRHVEGSNVWIHDNDAGVTLSPEGVAALRELLNTGK